MMSLVNIWAFIISLAIIMYVILDGFDLGIGILFMMVNDVAERDKMISSILPVWDGNETWLVLGAASLYSAFPMAYSILLPTLYMPITIMLASLVFRGTIIEFRFKAHKHRYVWDILFTIASTITALMQGIILGTFVKGYGNALPIKYSAYHWLTPFSLMTGIAVLVGYALLGSTWLILRTSDGLQHKMYHIAKPLLFITAIFLIVVSVWTPLIDPHIGNIWFKWPNIFYLMPLPSLTALTIWLNYLALRKRNEVLPFIFSIMIFVLCYIGFVISIWPFIVPHVLSFSQVAANINSLQFMFVGIIFLLPLLLFYTFHTYYIFQGKISSSLHY